MLNLSLCIHGAGFVAPEALPGAGSRRSGAREPDYAGIIAPMQLRRMSKVVRMGIGAAHACLAHAGLSHPDGIVVGTALGCLQDTEQFLGRMVVQEEQMLTPTSFIQSTHNTVAGQIALLTGCQGFNNTVSQRGHSFEGAVLSAAMYLAAHPEDNILCGGVDELTDTAFNLLWRAGVYSLDAIAGEGAGFLLLNNRQEGAKAILTRLEVFTETEPMKAPSRLNPMLEAAREAQAALLLQASGPAASAVLQEWKGVPPLKLPGWGTATAVLLAQMVHHWPVASRSILLVHEWGCGDLGRLAGGAKRILSRSAPASACAFAACSAI